MTVPGIRSLLGITAIGLLDGMVIGAGAVFPLLVNEMMKPAAHDSGEHTQKPALTLVYQEQP